MATLPSSVSQNYEVQIFDYPSDTWIISGDHISGMGTGQDAMKQAIDIILHVERFRYQIYSTDFGVEINSLIGKEQEYVESMLRRRISEALLVDKRIVSVSDFIFNYPSIGNMTCGFVTETVFGAIRREIDI